MFGAFAVTSMVIGCATAPTDPRRVRTDGAGEWTYFFDANRELLTRDGCCLLPDDAAKPVLEKQLAQFKLVPSECKSGVQVIRMGWAEGGKGYAKFRCRQQAG